MAEKKKIIGLATIKRVRLSYPYLYAPADAEENDDGELGKPKYRAAFLMPKPNGKEKKDSITTKSNLEILRKAKEEVMAAKWKDDIPELRPDRICVQDGKYAKDAYAKECFVLNASETDQPELLTRRKDREGLWIPAKPGEIYSGCWVSAIVLLWAMDHKKYGQRINASLKSVQFYEDGPAFGEKIKINRRDAFTDIEEDESSIGDDDDDDEDEDDNLI